jgi:hypothetical protein
MKRCLLLAALLVLAVPAQSQVYKWVDEDGKVHYSDKPPPPSARKSERKRLGSSAAESSMPYVLEEAVKNFPVTLYVYDCGDGCNEALAYLSRRGVPHTAKNPIDPVVREELKRINGGQVVAPVVQIGRTVLRGFQEREWRAALDNAGYPATAMIKLPPAKMPPPPPPAPAAQVAPLLEEVTPGEEQNPGAAETPAQE